MFWDILYSDLGHFVLCFGCVLGCVLGHDMGRFRSFRLMIYGSFCVVVWVILGHFALIWVVFWVILGCDLCHFRVVIWVF